ncbi:hypothetical protein BC936DRAFT_140559 [Jimgerdemannia flammicorona]|uniref:Uncharacterized protein n=1 Tax=Jimgerdemannia flammicorona TaxID=994334 RepID=A0A433AMY4_9FUNG|nr:hypothetical protein BC936DRAFT_140559 [Jimgerdemannia flammicorona]
MQNIPKPRRVELTLDYDNPSDTDSLSSSPVNYHPVPMPSGSRSRTPEVTQAPSSYSEHSALLGTPPPNYGERRPSRDYHFPASSTSVRPSATPSGQQTRLRPHLNPLQHRSSVPKRSLTFKWRRRRTGNYDEDRQGLLDERAGIRVWYENYSTIGKFTIKGKRPVAKRSVMFQ